MTLLNKLVLALQALNVLCYNTHLIMKPSPTSRTEVAVSVFGVLVLLFLVWLNFIRERK